MKSGSRTGEKISSPKKVLQFSLNGQLLQKHEDIKAAAAAVDRSEATIRSAVNKQAKAAGYMW